MIKNTIGGEYSTWLSCLLIENGTSIKLWMACLHKFANEPENNLNFMFMEKWRECLLFLATVLDSLLYLIVLKKGEFCFLLGNNQLFKWHFLWDIFSVLVTFSSMLFWFKFFSDYDKSYFIFSLFVSLILHFFLRKIEIWEKIKFLVRKTDIIWYHLYVESNKMMQVNLMNTLTWVDQLACFSVPR